MAELEGAYALAVVSSSEPDRLIVAREGCPVVVGLGVEENFVASDVAALLPVTRRFVFLEEGDVAEVRRAACRILDRAGNSAERADPRKRAVGRRRRKGPVPALHAQGDPRAAPRRRRHAAGARRQRPPAGGGLRAGGDGGVPAHRERAHRRLRHQLPRRAASRATSSSRSAGCRARSRSRASTATATRVVPRELAVRDHLAVRRDRRHARGAAARQAGRLSRRRSRSATRRRVRWCASRSSSC